MFGRSWRVGSMGGIPINLDSSWIWIAVLVTYSLWSQLRLHYPGVSSDATLAHALLGSVMFFGSVFLHEVAHAVAARIYGIRVFGITLVVFGGFTSARSDDKGPGPAFLISAVGPAMSLTLGVLFWLLSWSISRASLPLASMFGYVGWVNLFMAGFNVLPGLPLDGGRMLRSAVWRVTGNQDKGTRAAARGGVGLAILLIGIGLLQAARGNTFLFIWLALIGSFIFQGARGAERQLGLRERLARGTVADIMSPPPSEVPADLSLSETLDRYLRGHEGEAFPVVEDGNVIGMVSFESAREVGMRDPLRPVREALIPIADVPIVSPDDPLDRVAEVLTAGRAALVLKDGKLVGMVSGSAVMGWAGRAGTPP